MALNYPELHSIFHKLSNKTKITQFGIRMREIRIMGSRNKNKEATAKHNNQPVLFYFILNL